MQKQPHLSLDSDRSKDTRSSYIYAGIIYFLLFFTLGIVQTTFLSRFRLFGAVPDLTILGVAALAYFTNEKEGSICGLCAGVMIEALGSVGISLLPLIYMLLGYFLGSLGKYNMTKHYIPYLVYMTLTLIVRAVTTLLYAALTYPTFHLPAILTGRVLPEAAATLPFALLFYFPIKQICNNVRSKQFKKR